MPSYSETLLIRPPLVHSNVRFRGEHNDAIAKSLIQDVIMDRI